MFPIPATAADRECGGGRGGSSRRESLKLRFGQSADGRHAAPDWYRFKIGSIEATVISDGVLPLGEASNLVVEAPVAQFTKPIEE